MLYFIPQMDVIGHVKKVYENNVNNDILSTTDTLVRW